jgi:glycosyltransferase involved in cell wall biosynthesis
MNIKTMILWASFGPYHFSRFASFRDLGINKGVDVIGLEVSNKNITYGWSRGAANENGIFSLFANEVAESISPYRIFRALYTLLKKQKTDVVFIPSFWPVYLLGALLAAKINGCRVVFMTDSHYATGKNTGLGFVIKSFLVSFYDVAFVGGILHKSFVQYLGFPPSLVFDGYDTIDNDYFGRLANCARAQAEQQRLELSLPSKYILSLGRFVAKKNLSLVIGAYADLVAAGGHHGHDLVMVGSGAEFNQLVELAVGRGIQVIGHGVCGRTHGGDLRPEGANGRHVGQQSIPAARDLRPESRDMKVEVPKTQVSGFKSQLSVSAAVHFYPFAQVDTVPVYYALATAFVLASTTEEWGLVVNEAMACGCPVLVSKAVGSAPDLLLEGVTGYAFSPSKQAELVDCMARVCGDADHARELGARALQHIGLWSNQRFAQNALRAAKCALGDRGMVI